MKKVKQRARRALPGVSDPRPLARGGYRNWGKSLRQRHGGARHGTGTGGAAGPAAGVTALVAQSGGGGDITVPGPSWQAAQSGTARGGRGVRGQRGGTGMGSACRGAAEAGEETRPHATPTRHLRAQLWHSPSPWTQISSRAERESPTPPWGAPMGLPHALHCCQRVSSPSVAAVQLQSLPPTSKWAEG